MPDSDESRLESLYPRFVAGIDLPHQGVMDSYCSEIRARYHPNPTPDRWPLESLPLGSETGIQVTAVVGIGDHLGAATSGFSPGPRFCCFRRHHTPPHQILKT